MPAKFTIEKFARIYNDDTGEYVEVREDRDSLGLVEIMQGGHAILMPIEQARLLIDAIEGVMDHIAEREREKS